MTRTPASGSVPKIRPPLRGHLCARPRPTGYAAAAPPAAARPPPPSPACAPAGRRARARPAARCAARERSENSSTRRRPRPRRRAPGVDKGWRLWAGAWRPPPNVPRPWRLRRHSRVRRRAAAGQLRAPDDAQGAERSSCRASGLPGQGPTRSSCAEHVRGEGGGVEVGAAGHERRVVPHHPVLNARLGVVGHDIRLERNSHATLVARRSSHLLPERCSEHEIHTCMATRGAPLGVPPIARLDCHRARGPTSSFRLSYLVVGERAYRRPRCAWMLAVAVGDQAPLEQHKQRREDSHDKACRGHRWRRTLDA